MNDIRVGTLLSGAKPVGQGINGALRGFALVDEDEIQVIVKRLPERELLCELLCAQIGRDLGLPIPEPILLFDEISHPLFGSADVGYPNLLHFLEKDLESEIIVSKLRKWIYIESASFFDELIFNADRHPGNLLFDGNEFYLIDHGLTLHESYGPEAPPEIWCNRLMSLLVDSCDSDSDKSKICNKASAWIDDLAERDVIGASIKKTPGDQDKIQTLSDFLSIRKKLLLSMINHRVGASQTDFINA
ncbi:Phosphatidylinositol 3-and 4-kinase [Yersinia rohdei]|uniref:HipA family kinase n=1 Tax=Yersinia rohdei TaxID=29485 RepID=UPI00061C13D7|nr:HipA family kinase [Yersinia rohdei]CNF27303.1 Phosphatidylinositol 3-and 4-kinase [Yersinia rohdei]